VQDKRASKVEVAAEHGVPQIHGLVEHTTGQGHGPVELRGQEDGCLLEMGVFKKTPAVSRLWVA
jgi:hypothetical protein